MSRKGIALSLTLVVGVDIAAVICDLAVHGKWETLSVREGPYAEIKGLVVYRDQLVRRQTALKNRIRAVLGRGCSGIAACNSSSGFRRR